MSSDEELTLASIASPEPKITEKEKKALREFCLVSLQEREAAKMEKEEKKEAMQIVKEKKQKLDDWIRKQGAKCFSVPKTKYKQIEEELSTLGLPPLPTYVRLKKNTTDGSITPEVVEESIKEVSWETLQELEGDLHSKLTECILNNLRQNIRSSRESIALSDSLEKGHKIMEVPDLDEEALEYVLDMHKKQSELKNASKDSKAKQAQTKTMIKQLEAVVDKVLTKTNKTSQPITLQGVEGRHKIVKKTSTKSEKLTIKTFQEILTDSLEELELPSVESKESWKKIEQQKSQLIKLILLKINAIPKKESVSIKLNSKMIVEDDS
jgi:hypothetical protein